MSELPEGWELAEVGDLGEVRLGRQRSPDRAKGDHMRPYMRAANVGWSGVVLDDVKEMDFTPEEQKVYRLRSGDIIVGEASGSRTEVGKSAIWRDEVPGACFQNTLIRIRPNESVTSEFLQRHLHYDARSGRLAEISKGVGIHHLSANGLKGWSVAVPPLNEQKRIVAKIDALTEKSREAREALDAVPDLLDKLRQSILAAAFRGDLTKKWREQNPDVEPATVLLERIRQERRKKWEEAELAKFKAKGKFPTDDKWKAKYVEPEPVDAEGLPELPEGWCWASVEELLFPSTDGLIRQGWSPQCLPHSQQGEEDWAVIKTTAIQRLEFRRGENKQLPRNLEARRDLTLKEGDILMTRAGPRVRVGIPCRVGRDEPRLLLCDKAYLLRFDSDFVVSAWFVALLNAPQLRERIEEMKSGGSENGMNLTQGRLLPLPIPLAPIAEQRAIARSVAASTSWTVEADKESKTVSNSLNHLDSSILAKAFRGELVPQDPNDEPASVLLERIKAEREKAGGGKTRATKSRKGV